MGMVLAMMEVGNVSLIEREIDRMRRRRQRYE